MSKYVYTDDDLIEITEPVSKHQEHDQSTHGSWANTMVGTKTLLGTTVTSIIDKLSEKDTPGFTIDLRTKTSPKDGFVASDYGAERKLNWAKASSSRENLRNNIVQYVIDHAELLDGAGAFFGGWVNKGVLYLDVSRRYASRSEGVRAGIKNEQKAIYDVVKDSYIYMKDEKDDSTNKARSGGSSEASQGNDPTGIRSPGRRDGGSPDGQKVSAPHVCLGRYQKVEKHLEGQHDQATHGSWASGRFGEDSLKSARDGAKEYAFKAGIEQDDSIDYQKTVANRARAGRIADAYDELPTVQEEAFPAYEALATEVEAQFDYMTKTMGIKVEFVAEDPYKTSREMFADASTGVLKVLSTASTGSHPFFSDAQNDKFRAVHDYFGHAATGRGFGQDGEESAWVHHSQMFTETARSALTTETRGQNSWYNTRGQGFAEQKVALLPKEFWEVPKTFEKSYKVIYFEPGLIPVLKHGTHTQADHGNWARGISAEDDALINEMEGKGPSLQDLENMLTGSEQPVTTDLMELIANDDELSVAALRGMDERVRERLANLQQEFPNHKYTDGEKFTISIDVQQEMLQAFAEDDDGTLAQLWLEQNGSGFDSKTALPLFKEVYNISHDVIGKDGEPVTRLKSVTENVRIGDDNIEVEGVIKDSQGQLMGEFNRTFTKEQTPDGKEIWVVTHNIFKVEEYEGVGFAKKFIAQQEAWYTAVGVERIDLGTAWDGARHWAGAGYDFDDRFMDQNVEQLIRAKGNNSDGSLAVNFAEGSQNRLEFDSLMSKMVTAYNPSENTVGFFSKPSYGSTKKITSDDFPIPNDFAMIGYADKVQTGTNRITGRPVYMWAGARLLENLNLKYQKGLTKEGRSINQGPIDRDGDGLVYDGTAREKPAPVVN